jgi:hypothetical protein
MSAAGRNNVRHLTGQSSHSANQVAAELLGDVPSDLSYIDDVDQMASYDTTTESHVNNIFQSVLYSQFNTEANFLGVLPQVDRFEHGGVDGDVTAKAYRGADNPVPLQAADEGGDVPAGETFDVFEANFDPKRSLTVAQVSDIQQIRGAIEDAVSFDEFWEEQQNQLPLAIDRDALADVVISGGDQYDAVNTPTPLDRAIASEDEESDATDPNGDSYSAGDFDYGNIERQTADGIGNAFVSYVTNAQGANDTQTLDATLFNDFLNSFDEQADVDPYTDCIILTGKDTAQILSDLAADRSNIRNEVFTQEMSPEEINDAMTMTGLDTSARPRSYDGIPIVSNQNAPTHSADGISSVFLIPVDEMVPSGGDTAVPRIAIENLAPPFQDRAGRNEPVSYLGLGTQEEKAMIRFDHEVVIRDFSSTAKLRDLSS